MSVLFQEKLQDVNLLLLNSLKMEFSKKSSDLFMQELSLYFYCAEWKEESKYVRNFNEFEKFIFDNNLNQNTNIRIRLGTFDFVVEYISTERRCSVEVFLFLYTDIEIVNILYNICIDEISADELIYLEKVLINDKISVIFYNQRFLKNYDKKIKLTFSQITANICNPLIILSNRPKFKLKYFTAHPKNLLSRNRRNAFYLDSFNAMNKKKMISIEIRNIVGLETDLTICADFEQRYGKMIYGVLLMDEGYPYVPLNCALNALQDSFSSREHFKVYASNCSVLMINLIHSDQQKKYEALQKQLGEYFVDDNTKFICSHPEYAGLENGALLAMQRATMLYVIIDSNMQKGYYTSKNSIRTIIKNRRKMIELVNLVMNINLSEIASMSNTIMRKLGIFNYVDKVREKLDMSEEDTLIIYQKFNNILTLIIAIMGVIFAAMSITEIKNGIIDCIQTIFIK